MLLFRQTTDSMRLKLAGAVTANELPFVVGSSTWTDANTADPATIISPGVTTGTSYVTVFTAPSAGSSRYVKHFQIWNKDTAAATVQIEYLISGTGYEFKITLAVGDYLCYEDGRGWYTLDLNGNQKVTTSTSGINSFSTIAVSGQANVVADSSADTLTLVGTGLTITTDAATDTITFAAGGYPYVLLRDEKATGTNGGTFTSGAWQTRTLNTEKWDADNICTLASNQFTLSAGTYRVRARAPAFQVLAHQVRIQNITAGTTLVLGSSAYSDSAASFETDSWGLGRFIVAAAQTLELQHRCSSTKATEGFGVGAGSFDTVIYAEVELWKEP